ncbi:hypothetical protein Tco_0382173 [Tanacetum coccineum]
MYGFKECSSCGALYNKDHCCSVDTFVRDPNETPNSSKQSLPNCPNYGNPVDGLKVWKNYESLVTNWSDNIRQKKEQEEKRIAEEQVAKARYWKIPICNDDDEDDTIAITPVLPTMEPDNSLSMGDEHLSTIPKMKLDELIKSSDENLVPVPVPSEFEDECECDVPDCDDSQTTNFSTLSNPLFDDSTFNDDESSHEEIDSLFDEFAGELIKIPLRIVNREHEEYISLLERLLYDNSSPRLSKDFHANPNTIIEFLLTFPIPVEDSDSLREEIDIFLGPDDSIPPGIESDD